MFAEVKWSNKPVGINIYYQLEEKAKLVSGPYRRRFYALISRSGFTPAMKKLAREKSVLLIHGERKM